MSRKQKAGVLNKFLDLIGIVDTDDGDQGDGYESDFDNARGRNTRGAAKNPRFNDEFDNEPRMSRSSSRSKDRQGGAAPAGNANQFDAEEVWGEENTSRPEYGARTQQRAQSKTRPSAGRYSGEQYAGNTGSKTGGRYEGNYEDDSYHRSGSAYQQNNYQSGSYRSGSSYEAGSHRYGTDSSYNASRSHSSSSEHASGRTQEQPMQHKTEIFKLHSVDECKGVIMALIEKKSVLLILEEMDSMQVQRTLDTVSGATFAIGALLNRASDRTWLITPNTVEVNDKHYNTGANTYGNRYM